MQIFQEQKPVQQQRPQMYAAVEILQLDVCQLQSYINTALLENPTLECGAAPGVSLLDDLSAGGHAAAGEDAEHMQPDFADRDAVAYGEDLTTHLQFQAERLSLGHLPFVRRQRQRRERPGPVCLRLQPGAARHGHSGGLFHLLGALCLQPLPRRAGAHLPRA